MRFFGQQYFFLDAVQHAPAFVAFEMSIGGVASADSLAISCAGVVFTADASSGVGTGRHPSAVTETSLSRRRYFFCTCRNTTNGAA
jgi:hypothetical protein